MANEESYVLELFGAPERPLITIDKDGTVTIHEEGAEKEAARVFYEALEFEGRTLVKRIETLETALTKTERWLRGLGHAKMANRIRNALEGK
jgi:hypothetical protein